MTEPEQAECRHCRMLLRGKPYYMGGVAHHPKTNERCNVNFYGGYVCSERCDYNASLALEQSMPGHGYTQQRIGQLAQETFNRNWRRP